MPDTGAPWNIPYVASTDLVSDWPTDSQDLADAIADGLDAAVGLVEVKSALFTGTQTNSTAAGADFAITDLSITHEVADASNKLIISGFVGMAGKTASSLAEVGVAVHDGSSLINIATSPGSRVPVTAGGNIATNASTYIVTMPSFTYVHTPGSGSKTYTLRAINIGSGTATITINRSGADSNNNTYSRGVSGLVIQEVKV